jgi:hypothetical protein
MSGGAVRRTVLVLLLYALGAWAVLLVGGWLSRVLALPMLFDRLLQIGLYLGVAVAALLAWHYPRLAAGSGDAGGPPAAPGERRS